MTPSNKELVSKVVEDMETAREIFEKSLSLFKDNPDSIPVFKNASE